jgi:hypothetical protein
MSQTLVTKMFRNTGEIGRPTTMLAYLLNISFVAKSISFLFEPRFRTLMPARTSTFYFILSNGF